jgi:hypothetical protein
VATRHAPSQHHARSMSGVEYADVPADPAQRASAGDRPGIDTTASIAPPSATGRVPTEASPSSRQTASLEGGGLSLPAPEGLSLFEAPSEVSSGLAAPLPPVRPAEEKQTGPGAAPRAALPSVPPPNGLGAPRKLTRRPSDAARPSASAGTMSQDVADVSSRNLTVRPEARSLLPPRLRPGDEQGSAARSSTRVVVPLPARLLPDFEQGQEQE